MKEKNVPLQLLADYMDGHRPLITLGRILAAASALIALLTYYELWNIIRIACRGEQLSTIPAIGWRAVGIMVFSMLIYVCALMCTHIAAFHVQAVMRTNLMRHIMTLPPGIFDEEGSGKIRRVVNDSTATTETYIAHILPDQAVATATPLGLLLLMLFFDWKLGLLCLLPGAIAFLFVAGMRGQKMQESMKYYQNAMDTISNEGVEYVRGIPVVKTFGQTIFSFKRFSDAIDNFTQWSIAYTKRLTWPMVAFLTAVNAVFVALIAGAYFFGQNGISTELILNMMYYILITPLLTVTLTKIAYSGEQTMTVIDAIERVQHLLEIAPLSDDGAHPMPSDATITFHNVVYRYPGAQRNALNHVSFTIPAGSHVALVGPSGSGKSTAAQLMARFLEVSGGNISIGGIDLRKIRSDELSRNISFVFQESRLLKRSIADNVRLAKPDASDEEVLEALKKAQCMNIIEKMPQGIHTMIGTKGTYLSGGEQQRITIARAFLKNAPILILDEATAFADPDNEVLVQKAFEELSKNRTVIMIAHRLSTVVNADCIYVLDNGVCVESGTHPVLMAKNGRYAAMYADYQKSVQWKVGA